MLIRKKKSTPSQSWHILPMFASVVSGESGFFPHPKGAVRGTGGSNCPSLSECGCVGAGGPVMEGRPVRVGPILHPELLGEAPPPRTLNWNWLAGKECSYFLLIPLKCVGSSH